jgi:alpha-soluble NSF attachment protein
VAEKYMQNKLTAPSAKEQYFKAILLFLANDDAIGANQALERYTNSDPTFYQTRQQKFCQALVKSVRENELELFSNEWYQPYLNLAINSTRSFPWTSGKQPFSAV